MNFQISSPTWAPSFPKKCPPCNFLFTTLPLSPTMKVIIIPNGSTIDPFRLFLKCTSFAHCVLFCIRFLSLNIFLRCSHVVCICSLCLFVVEWRYHLSVIHSSTEGHLSCCQFKIIRNKAVVNVLVHVFMWLMYTLVVQRNPFLLGKTKAVRSGSKIFIESNRTLAGWPEARLTNRFRASKKCPRYSHPRRLSNAPNSSKAAVSDGNEWESWLSSSFYFWLKFCAWLISPDSSKSNINDFIYGVWTHLFIDDPALSLHSGEGISHGSRKRTTDSTHAMETKETDLISFAESMLLKKFPHSHNDALLPFPLLRGNFTDLLSVYCVPETNHFILLCACSRLACLYFLYRPWEVNIMLFFSQVRKPWLRENKHFRLGMP